MKLYNYWRSSSSWRVRIVLEFKGLTYDYVPVHLVNEGGEQHRPEFVEKNPSHQVPLLEVEVNGTTHFIGQSVAIFEFLEAQYPDPAFLPSDPILCARTRQLAEVINSGTQPLQNLTVIQKLKAMELSPKPWCQEFIAIGLKAYEGLTLKGAYSIGEQVTWADACLVPQLYNARRFDVDLSRFPRLLDIEAACLELPAFRKAHPDVQPDAA